MPDWKEMYLTLMRETESAIRILVGAQKTCEELYLQDSGPSLLVLPSTSHEDAGAPENQADSGIKNPPGVIPRRIF